MKRIFFVFSILYLGSCDSSRVYEDFKSPNGYWDLNEHLTFPFEIKDTTTTYRLIAQFKNDVSFPFNNLYFNYSLTKPSGESEVKSRLEELILFEPKTGEPFGSGIGDSFDHEHVLEESITFSSPGVYTASLQQFMRLDSIPHIDRVGFRVEKN